jgi:hypothetical protein
MNKKIKGIEIFTQITKDLLHSGFDGFEVHPCREYDKDTKSAHIEQCEASEAEFWSVYVHLVGAGLDCIADCETENEANDLITFLKTLIVKFKGDK